MIAVVFEPRYGSSKVMQALADSGYPVVGEKFPSWMDPELHKWNPLGFYECQNPAKAIAAGIGRAAIKLRLHEVKEISLPADTRFVICTRDEESATWSQMRSGFKPWAGFEAGLEANARDLAEMEALLSRNELADVIEIRHEDWTASPDSHRVRLLEWAHGA